MSELVSKKCPSCGGPVPIHHPKYTYSFYCPHCGMPISYVTDEKKPNKSKLIIIKEKDNTKGKTRDELEYELKMKKEENKQEIRGMIIGVCLMILMTLFFFSLSLF